ncbi:MAG: cell wall hydrolase [Defluviitaleaceae bacterium]|nr:cell wall hydrolase [Defluviitaleaceae bacterium]
MITLVPFNVYGMCTSFEMPKNRVVINNSHDGIYFAPSGDTRYIPVRSTFESLGANVEWCYDSASLTVEYNGTAHTPEFILRDNRSYVRDNIVTYITNHYLEFLPCINAMLISSHPNSTTPEELVHVFPSFYDYTEEDLMWLSRIIHAEARGEPYEAMLAVGNVVLNRKASSMYPDTIRDVIFDRRNGIQFTPTVNGAINNTPSTASFLAAVEVLEGRQNAEGVLFFKNPRISSSTWMSRNRPFAFTLNNHDFFY